MTEPTNILFSKIAKLENEIDIWKAELAWYEKRDLVWKLRRESRIPAYVWNGLRLNIKLMKCSGEEEMMPWIEDAQTIADRQAEKGIVKDMGEEFRSEEEDISENTKKARIKAGLKLISGGKKDG